jgi:hypothetical protein
MSNQPSGIKFNAKLSLWFILSSIFPLTIEIDGTPIKGAWGEQFLNLAPGTHHLSASWKLYWVLPVNAASLDVTVPEGGVVPVRYKLRWIWFLPGKMYIDQPTPSIQAA